MSDDTYRWLEEIEGTDALAWARERSDATLAELSGPRYEALRTDALDILDSEDRIPFVVRRGDYLYNFWRDANHPKGLWRRTTLTSFRTDAPEWDVLIDVDALATDDGENWVWHGATVLRPSFDRALISLSPGGSDAALVREFDMATRTFVDDGFSLPTAKSSVGWIDRDTVYVGTDFDGEDSLTESGTHGW